MCERKYSVFCSTLFDLLAWPSDEREMPQGQEKRLGGGGVEDVRERGRHLSWVPSMYILYKGQNHTKLINSINVRIVSEEIIQICALITVAHAGIFKTGALDEMVAQSYWVVGLSGVRLAGLFPSYHSPKNSPLIGAFRFVWFSKESSILQLEAQGIWEPSGKRAEDIPIQRAPLSERYPLLSAVPNAPKPDSRQCTLCRESTFSLLLPGFGGVRWDQEFLATSYTDFPPSLLFLPLCALPCLKGIFLNLPAVNGVWAGYFRTCPVAAYSSAFSHLPK